MVNRTVAHKKNKNLMLVPWIIIILLSLLFIWFLGPAISKEMARIWGLKVDDNSIINFGVLSTLFSGLAFAALLINLIIQSLTLNETRKQISESKRREETSLKLLTLNNLFTAYSYVLTPSSGLRNHITPKDKSGEKIIILDETTIRNDFSDRLIELEEMYKLYSKVDRE